MTTESQETNPAETNEPAGIEVELFSDPTTGYAAIQNNVPVVRTVAITNHSSDPITEVELVLGCSPAFATGTHVRFERLAPGESRKLSPVDLRPDHAYLSCLNEAEHATIAARATSAGELLAEATHAIEVLAYDQWAGTRSLPELLAAFCMPNCPVVDQLVRKASTILRDNSPGFVMDGYQSSHRERVWKQVSALYSTLLSEDIHYSNPPASFGSDGQKIRTPERMIEGRLGTCLDLSMLFASCVEQVGLNPVVLFKQGHAWVGVWLIQTNFPAAVIDDVQAVRKRVKSGELMVFEATGIAAAQKPSLRWACLTGEEHLNEDGTFHYAVDIRRAREFQIRALPSKRAAEPPAIAVASDATIPTVEDMPPLPPLDPELLPVTGTVEPDTPEGRLAKWKSKLLDLTLRNRLLNFKATQTNLRVICHNPAALEDALAEGKEFRIRAMPQLMEGDDPRESAVFQERGGRLPQDAMAEDALSRREILVDLPENKLEGRLTELFRAAATGLEEGGANTLFLVFGQLEWREEKDSETCHLAPILLVPVTLTRTSVRSGFRVMRHDDDALVNPTLIQKLWQDFNLKLPAFDVLPTDEKGIDVGKILQTFRLQVAEIKGWEVREQVHLGIFSFTKYLMWKDLQDRQQQLQDSRVVAHLINHPGSVFPSNADTASSENLDTKYRPQDLLAPLLADSSQLRAISIASAGANLVLEGPPGTGKSQTITNLIAHLLATGKTVLFVSEKMAALEVVHRRLNQLGLGPFCLELHSSKAKKSDVLKQMGAALDAAGLRTVKEWEMEAGRLTALRQELNALTQALHREYPNDLTIHGAIGTCIKYAHWQAATMDWSDPRLHDRGALESLRDLSRQMAALASQISDPVTHPLSAIKRGEWSPSWQEEVLLAAGRLAQAAGQMQRAAESPLKAIGLPHAGLSLNDFAALDVLADALLAAPTVPVGIARMASDDGMRSKLRTLRRHGVARLQAWESLLGHYRESVASVNAAELDLLWAEANATWWPRKWFAKRAITARLRVFRIDQLRPDETQVPSLLEYLAKLNAEDRALAAMSADATGWLDDEFDSHRTNWDSVATHERWARSYAEAILRVAGTDTSLLPALQARLQSFVGENRALLKGDGVLGAALLHYRDTHRQFLDALHRVRDLCGDKEALTAELVASGAIQRLLSILQCWKLASRELQPWCLWQRVRASAMSSGLQGIVRALEVGDTALGDVADYFEYSYQNWWVRKAIDREPVLCTFSSADHERKIREFRQTDERFQTLTQQYIVARLAGLVPASSSLTPSAESEMGRLRREIQKQRNHMPIRQLVKNLPTLLPRLKPCLLMSPLSVAQYLETSHAQFDVVVFDEASQIPVWDAVGAIARGRQLVCVGDPKQLPPTNFFNRVDTSDEIADEGDIQDLESILDECLGIGMPRLSLEWHYRSRHESLITFSNVTYYENRLVTFPSPVTEDSAVKFQHVAGVYDRGGSRTNRAEAEAIVRSIERHFTDPACRSHSLGVVTFNQPQQCLIENLLDARRRASAELDQAIAQAGLEPLFIKNLENVQGDERDVIFFSVTYGPDASGKVS